MSAHYNRVMMRQLRDPFLELLRKVSTACNEIVLGTLLPENLGEGGTLQDAMDLSSSLRMMGCLGLAQVAQGLAQALDGLANAPARGWNDNRAREIAKDARQLAEELAPQLNRLAEDEPVLPAILWPSWARLLDQMNEPVPGPEALFEPVADFDDTPFERLDPSYLKEVVEGATVRLNAAVQNLGRAESDHDVAAFSNALSQVQEVFDWAYRTRHRKRFQPYWLIVRGRLSEARLHAAAHLDASDSIRVLIRNGNLELQRFGANAARVGPDRLLADISPLLGAWTPDMESNEVLSEVRQRFGLDDFWQVMREAHEKKERPAGQVFEQTRPELNGLLERVCDAWARWSSSTGDMRDVVRAYAGLVMRQADLPSDEARDLIKTMQVALEWAARRVDEDPDLAVNGEISSGLVTLEDALSSPGVLATGLSERLIQQTRRLRAVMVPGRAEYQQLPTIRWSPSRRRQEALVARKKAVEQLLKDLGSIEDTLENIMRDETDPKEHRTLLAGLLPPLEVGAAALGLLRLPRQARLYAALRDRLERLSAKPVLFNDEAERNVIAQALPALMGSLQAQLDGPEQEDDNEFLSHAGQALLNETLEGVRHSPEWRDAAPVALEDAPALVMPTLLPSFESSIDLSPGVEAVGEDAVAHPAPGIPAEDTSEASAPLSVAPSAPVAAPDVASLLLSSSGFEDTLERADPEIAEGFFEEAPAVLIALTDWRATLLDRPQDEEAWEELRRGFHTIKGSGRFVYLTGLTEVAWWMERFVSDEIKARRAYSDRTDAIVQVAIDWFTVALSELESHRRAILRAQPVWDALNGLVPDASVSEPNQDESEFQAAEPEQEAEASSSALAQWAHDPEGQDAIREDLRRRRADLSQVLADEDPELMERVAHTLRTLANMLGMVQWEDECAEVERYLAAGHGLTSSALDTVVDRWMQVIDDVEMGASDPETALSEEWALPAVFPLSPEDLPQPSDAVASEAEDANGSLGNFEQEEAPRDREEDGLLGDRPPVESPEGAREDVSVEPEEEEIEFHEPDEFAAIGDQPLDFQDTPFETDFDEEGEGELVPEAPSVEQEDVGSHEPTHNDDFASIVKDEGAETEQGSDSIASSPEIQPASSGASFEGPVRQEDLEALRAASPGHRDELWDEVFSAFDLLMEGGRRLGVALERLAREESEQA